MFDAKGFMQTVPQQPGVYRMLNAKGVVIYVGKAKNLKNRLSSYFRAQVDSIKTKALVSQIAQVELTLTHSETEALLLENNLIKAHRPKYNILLRDDKSYPYIILSDHRHPRLLSHRGSRSVAGQYFGPYPNAGAVWQSLKLMQKIFPIRQCEDSFYQARTRPCLQYQLKLCSAPCVGKVSDEDYQEQVRLARLFLTGKDQQIVADLVQQMEQASAAMEFETAARLRDQIQALRRVQEQQSVSGDHEEMDVIGYCFQHEVAAVHVLYIRQHKVIGSKTYFPKLPANTDVAEILPAFLLQFYLQGMGGQQVPKEVVLAQKPDDSDALQQAISQVAGRKVKLTAVQRGEKARYLELASKNARIACEGKVSQAQRVRLGYQALNQLFKPQAAISHMECFDISHTMGQDTIASCVVFDEKGPNKTLYRRYNVKGITGGDDYAAMDFALNKRYGKLSATDPLPDLILIDGGKGQLQRAVDFFANHPCQQPPLLMGVAKGVSRKAGLETLLIPGQTDRNLAENDPALHLIQQIRDESHRFAITGHRNKRGKALLKSSLEQIPGIGAKRRQALLHYLGGMQGVQQASVEQLASVPGISKQQAEKIYQSYRNK
ncbi:excinuclease ABC subunit UvrC [Alkalimonas collagenimarina]|uniref:UvrABC system protein C n=1 Tax=Alkalimonas collagenimarina TaxID=400390 RepID=A0ABT9H289_9GAMM|nr:excinuclease ABC subunit UvrC [Alkalimonas collagenimarina]MDP4537189.1 excinuclease ABC subunit UvrC [Alkalimonas collagenimarina]